MESVVMALIGGVVTFAGVDLQLTGTTDAGGGVARVGCGGSLVGDGEDRQGVRGRAGCRER